MRLRPHLIVDSRGVRDREGEQVHAWEEVGTSYYQPGALIAKLTSHCAARVNKSRQFGFLPRSRSAGCVPALISFPPSHCRREWWWLNSTGGFCPRSVGRTLVVFYSHPRVCSVQYRMLHSELESLMLCICARFCRAGSERVERKGRDGPDGVSANILVSTQLVVLATRWLGLVLHPLGFFAQVFCCKKFLEDVKNVLRFALRDSCISGVK